MTAVETLTATEEVILIFMALALALIFAIAVAEVVHRARKLRMWAKEAAPLPEFSPSSVYRGTILGPYDSFEEMTRAELIVFLRKIEGPIRELRDVAVGSLQAIPTPDVAALLTYVKDWIVLSVAARKASEVRWSLEHTSPMMEEEVRRSEADPRPGPVRR